MNKRIIKQIIEKIEEYEIIHIFGHTRPDGDCYGSAFGLKNIIQTNYPKKTVRVILEASGYLGFVGTPDILDEDLVMEGLSIVVDTSTKDRISCDKYILGKEVIKIDHHDPVDHYGVINFELPEYPATAQIISEIAMTMKLNITVEGANALYTGIATDTGWFKYRGVVDSTFEVAAFLVRNGVQVDVISEVLSKTTLEELKFKSIVIDRLKKSGHFLYCTLPKDVIEANGLTNEQASNYVNLFAMVEGYPVWALIIEGQTGALRLRIRSSRINIIPLASLFEGGGHDLAVGGKLRGWEDLDFFVKTATKFVEDNL